jgi:tetratricopeptide (TPR) repeat protein
VRYASIIVVALNPFVPCSYAENILSQGDEAVLAAPVANFRNELRRLRLPPAQFQAVDTDGQTNIAIEIEDLRTALVKAGRSSNDVEQITADHLGERNKLAEFDDQWERAGEVTASEPDENGNVLKVVAPEPLFPKIQPEAELPKEFDDYLQGTVAWHNPALANKSAAREAWERILSRPATERRFKSTWAAFMLGRSLQNENPEKAIGYFQQVRALAKEGYSDRLGLAAASLGWEARVWLNRTNFERAIDLYLEQMATGDRSAPVSLCLTMREVVGGGTGQFTALAENPRTRRVVTAYIISTKALQISYVNSGDDGCSNRLVKFVSEWVAANEAAKVNDPEMAEQLALAAYQNGEWETASKWIARSGASPVAQWLQAKLLFRANKLAQAGSMLERVAALFPLNSQHPRDEVPRDLKDSLTVSQGDYYWSDSNAPRHIRGELGVFHFSRGQYAQALDDFLRADFWEDAAYVAERILSVDELKSYVDQNWPLPSAGSGQEEQANDTADEVREKIRYLLARRLTRMLRGDEARDYYPSQWQTHFDELATALRLAWDESLPSEQRVRAFVDAAIKTRSAGMELLGTEVAPDWHIYDGSSEGELTAQFRRTNENFTLIPASPDELSRYAQNHADPEMRFHYRYQAAFLGWEAAKMLPNDSDETARILCLAGSWLKVLDPKTADLFYKALTRRCPNTEIGAEANRIHWFPKVDDDGNLVTAAPKPENASQPMEDLSQEDNSSDTPVIAYPTPGHNYVIQVGDTLEVIAHAASEWGETVTVDDIVAANPGLRGEFLLIGQVLLIPARTEKE